MRWRVCGPDDEDDVRGFLSDREYSCVAAASRFLCRDAQKDRAWLARDEEGRAVSFVLLSGGILHPVFGSADIAATARALRRIVRSRALFRFPKGRPVSSVQGLSADVAVAESVLGKLAYATLEGMEYVLMRLDSAPDDDALGAGPDELRVYRLDPDDDAAADRLYPLQRAYEREEVLPANTAFNPAACRLALERTIRTRIVVVGEADGVPVAKANTNARSYARDQIGGVYVLPAYRNRGIATRLVAALAAEIAKEGRCSSLFVKADNAAARHAYAKIGFKTCGDYRIKYYIQ